MDVLKALKLELVLWVTWIPAARDQLEELGIVLCNAQ